MSMRSFLAKPATRLEVIAVALVLAFSFGYAVEAQAHQGVEPCERFEGGEFKVIPREQCAHHAFLAYVSSHYWTLGEITQWYGEGYYGNWHSRWLVTTNGINRVEVQLSAKHTCGHFVVYDHRANGVWPHGWC